MDSTIDQRIVQICHITIPFPPSFSARGEIRLPNVLRGELKWGSRYGRALLRREINGGHTYPRFEIFEEILHKFIEDDVLGRIVVEGQFIVVADPDMSDNACGANSTLTIDIQRPGTPSPTRVNELYSEQVSLP